MEQAFFYANKLLKDLSSGRSGKESRGRLSLPAESLQSAIAGGSIERVAVRGCQSEKKVLPQC